MIKASKTLIDYIKAQEKLEEFSSRSKISRNVLYSLMRGKTPSTDTVTKILNITGLDFEKAFEKK